MIPADEALERLRDGNRRFVAELGRNDELSSESRRRSLATRQQPFAIILGCSDSRVPAELIFDQGLGDLFVIRTAGHVLDQAAFGSIEFGAAELGIQLLVVLGHEQCGAVAATIAGAPAVIVPAVRLLSSRPPSSITPAASAAASHS